MSRATFRFFADETAEDAAANKSDEEIWWRNSLFLKRRKIDGTAGSRESSDRWNVFAVKTVAAKLRTSVAFGVLWAVLCGIIAPVV